MCGLDYMCSYVINVSCTVARMSPELSAIKQRVELTLVHNNNKLKFVLYFVLSC